MKKITQFVFGFTFLLFSFLSFGQIVAIDKFPKDVPVMHFQQPNLTQIIQEDIDRDNNGEFYRIGILGSEVNITPQNSGTWTTKANGDRVWRLKIKYPGAQGMSFMFSKFHLFGGSTINVYNSNGISVHGTFSSKDVLDHGQQNLSLCEGDLLMLELTEPKNTQASILEMNEIIYIYRGFKAETQDKNFGASDPCQVNVNCTPVGTNWQNQKRGVARILVSTNSGQGWCTGSLVNNVRQDCTPYFLTAYHCGGNATTAQFNQWRFYFRFEAPSCANPSNQSGVISTGFFTGCIKVSDSNNGGSSSSDMLLLHLGSLANASTTINTLKTTHNVYWNGWDANNTATTGGVGIHHPAGDIKKISTFSGNTVSTQWGSASGSHWRVTWTSNSNGHGVTEGGSSGSPLFNNSNGRIIGTLTGGSSYCSAQSSPDLYGKMSYHWTSNGTADNRRLKPYLDPDNTGVLVLNGSADPCGTSPGAAPNANFVANQTNVPTGTTVTFTDQTTGSPTSWSWSITPATGWAYTGSSATSQNPQVTFNTAGSYTIALTATNANGSDTETKNNYIVVTSGGGGGTPCAATSTECDEFIAQVQLNTINNSSACTNYTDYSSISTTLTKGQQYTINVIPQITGEAAGTAYTNDQVAVWIDYNNNGSFTDAGEQVGVGTVGSGFTGSFTFTVPTSASTATVRMRVRIFYPETGIPTITPCGTTQYGEVEDYRINLVATVGLEDLENLNAISLYPNPTADEVTVDLGTTVQNADIFVLDVSGKEVLRSTNNNVENVKLNLSGIATGVYQVIIQTELGKVVKRVTKQ